jgi:hypothetical protein
MEKADDEKKLKDLIPETKSAISAKEWRRLHKDRNKESAQNNWESM